MKLFISHSTIVCLGEDGEVAELVHKRIVCCTPAISKAGCPVVFQTLFVLQTVLSCSLASPANMNKKRQLAFMHKQ